MINCIRAKKGDVSMNRFHTLSKAQKGRILSFVAIAAVLLCLILLFAWNIRIQTPAVAYTDSCNVDGSDFSPAANLCIAGFNGVVMLLNMTLNIGVVWILSTASILGWRFIAIQKESVVTEFEWKIAKYTWFSFIGASLIGCLVILHFSHLTYCTFLTALPILLMWLMGVLPLQKKYWKCKDTPTVIDV